MSVTLTYSERHNEHTVHVNGEEAASAHCVNVPADIWSVKVDGRFFTLANGEQTAVAVLRKVAAKFEAMV